MKSKLLMFIATLVASVCAVVVQAQTDVTSQYLKNTDFETTPVTFTENNGSPNGTPVTVGKVTSYEIPNWDKTTGGDYPRFLSASYGITFATKPDLLNGVNPPAADKDGNATGSVLMMSGSWGSTVVLTQSVELPEGKYALTYDVLNQNAAGKIGSNRFGFAPTTGTAVYGTEKTFAEDWTTHTVTFSLIATTEGKISIGIVGDGGGAGGNAKLAIDNIKLLYYGIDKTGLTDKIAEANGYYSGEGKNAAEFKAAIDAAQAVADKADATMAEVVEAIATLENAIFAYRVVNASPLVPVDVTAWMPEAGMDNGKTGVWKDIAGQNELKDNTSSYSGFSGKFLEEWAASSSSKLATLKDFNITQTITGLPNGIYTFKAYCMATQQGKSGDEAKTYVNNVSLYANGASMPVATLNGTPELFVVENAVVSDGTLTVGFKSENGTANWIAMDNASLIYSGFDTDEAIKALNAKVAEGDALLAENPKMQIAASQALSKALEDAKAMGDAPTQEMIESLTADLSKALKNANVSVEVYTSLNDAISSSNTNKANYTELPGYAAFEAAIAVAQGVYDAATTDSLVTAQAITTLKKAEVTCRLTQVAPADFSWIIVNPNADDKYNGWTTTGMVKGPATGQDWAGTTNPYFDGGNYDGTGWSVTMSQTIEGLPAGKYTVKAVTRASTDVAMNLTAKTNAFHAEQACVCVGNTGGSIFDNAADGTPEKAVNGNKGFGWTNSSVNITVNEGSPLIIGMTATTAAKSQWFSIDQFELVYNSAADAAPALPANVSEIEAGKEYVIQLKEAGKIMTAKDKLPVVNKYQDGEDDAFTFVAEKEGEDTYKFKQKSTGLYVAAVSNSNWDMTMTDGTTADITGFKVTLNNGVYSISSMKNTAKFVGLGSASEETLYFDKGSDKPHSFIVMDAPEYFTYAIDLVFSDTRAKLLNAIKDAVALQDETAADDRFSQEAKAAYTEIIDAAGKTYEEATETEALQAAVDALASQLHIYLTSGKATEENPIDFTRLVINPTMTGSANGWTSDTNAQNKGLASNKQGAFTGTFLENWLGSNISGKIWQKITNLPKGKYVLKAAAFTNTADKEGVSLYINEDKTSVTSVDPAFYTVTANVMGNTIEIGLSIEPSVTNWVGLDNVTLSYCGYGLSSIIEALQTKVAEAEAMGDAMQKDLYEALGTAVTTATTAIGQAEPVQEDLEAALADLEIAITNATPSVAAYAKLAAAIDAAKAASVAAKDPVPTAIDAATVVYTAKEADTADITEAIATLRKVVNIAIVANATDGDVTEMIINPGFEEDNANGWMFNPEANTGAAANKEYEIFSKLYDMYQTITEVPAGVYQLQVQGFHRAKANDAGAAYKAGTEVIKSFLYAESDKNEAKAPMMSLYAEEGTGTSNGYANSMAEARTAFDAGKYTGNVVNMIAVANDTLSIGVRYEGTLEANSWTIFDNFKLIYLGTEADIMADVKAELTDSITVATGLKEGATKALIVKAEMNKLVAAVDGGNTAVNSTVLSEMNDALTILKVAITDARTSIGLCTDLAVLFTEATTLITTYKEAYDPTALQAVLNKNLNMYQNQTDQTDNAALVAAKAEMEAALTTYKETVKSDVDVVNAESVKVYVNGSSIVVDGADDYDVYTEGGIRVNANTELVPGIYIVKVAGQTVKIQVK